MSPQPPASSALWQGHPPGDGAVYTRICPLALAGAQAAGGLGLPFETFWSAAPPPQEGIDPEVLARRAVDQMLLAGPDIASPRPAGRYLVGVPMWLWVHPSPTTYGPNTATATAGAVTVTATAHVTKIEWRMDDGATVTCHGPGTAYRAAYRQQPSPTCGHLYTRSSAARANARYVVSATSTWTVHWQVVGGGASGQLSEVRQSQVEVAVGELQVVN